MTTNSILTPADAEAMAAGFIARRYALHGDARMDATDDGTGKPGDDDGKKPDDTGGKPDDERADETPEEAIARLTKERDDNKAEARKHEGRHKATKDKARLWDEAEAAKATPDQKLVTAEKRATDAEAELARYKVAHELTLPASLLSLLNGDEDQMREQAKALLEFKGTTKKTPVPDLTQGGQGKKTTTKADDGRAEAQRRYPKPAKS